MTPGHVSPLPVPRFGPPLVLREERGVSWEQLQQSILAQLRGVLQGEVRPQVSPGNNPVPSQPLASAETMVMARMELWVAMMELWVAGVEFGWLWDLHGWPCCSCACLWQHHHRLW